MTTNDIDHGPLAGWWLVIAHGRTFLGARDGFALAPVYDLVAAIAPTPDGRLATMRQVIPVLTYPTINRLELPQDAVWIPVRSLDNAERRELEKGVTACEELMRAMRAQSAGIAIAPAGTKLPPLTGRR